MEPRCEILVELEKAVAARARGNEGQARVCARRAAGVAARDYFARHGQGTASASAYDVLRLVAGDTSLPALIRQFAARLTLRVDEEFRLPPGVDLIAEARALCKELADAP